LRDWLAEADRLVKPNDYYDYLRRLTARLNDSHVTVVDPANPMRYTVPVRLGKIEGRLIVLGKEKGPIDELGKLDVGDEVVQIDNMEIKQFEDHWRARISASTPQALSVLMYSLGRALGGAKDAPIRFRLKRVQRAGEEVSVTARRSVDLATWTRP